MSELEGEHPEHRHLDVDIHYGYAWSTGEITGAFLEALRDRRMILGALCRGCKAVAVPPCSYCEKCGASMKEWREVGPRGVVVSWARPAAPVEGAPVDVPFRYVLVRLAGADTSMLHVAPDDDRVRTGAAVIAEFRDDRVGSIRDIRWFIPET